MTSEERRRTFAYMQRVFDEGLAMICRRVDLVADDPVELAGLADDVQAVDRELREGLGLPWHPMASAIRRLRIAAEDCGCPSARWLGEHERRLMQGRDIQAQALAQQLNRLDQLEGRHGGDDDEA